MSDVPTMGQEDVSPAASSTPPAPAGHGGRSADWPGWAACALAAAGFVACLLVWLGGGASSSWPWMPSLDLHLSFSLDGLGALYALLATGIGVLVFAYGTAYLPLHLAHDRRPASERWRFWPWLALFAVAMVGLATAQDLVLVFLFFDVTAICSYFLIGFDRNRQEAHRAALMALLVTVVSAVALLIAAVLLYAEYGTFSIPQLVQRVDSGTTMTVAAALLAVAGLAKSAQVPLHFWLPRAMAAPTPVSAYLHSAAMVAAGVLVLGRVHPLLARSDVVLTGLLVVGTASIVVGGVLALGQDVLKQVLAYSTISQYGYVVVLYGIGGPTASGAAAFYVLAHGVAKSALFMTAGAVTMATGQDRLSRLGGLGRRSTLLAAAAAVAAANLAGLPLTAGFFKDELFFQAAHGAGAVTTVIAVLAAGLTLGYIGRFWVLLFLGRPRTEPSPVPRLLTVPITVLAVVSVLAGVVPRLFATLAADAGSVSNAAPVDVSPAYHLDARPANLMALSAWVLGALLLALPRLTQPGSLGLARAGDRFGPQRGYARLLRFSFRLSGALHDREVRDLRSSVAAILVPAGLLIALAFAVTPTVGVYTVGTVAGTGWLVVALLGLVVVAAWVTARSGARLGMVLALSVVGFALAGVYALVSAPDVALVSVVVETMLTLVFLAALARLPREAPPAGRSSPAAGSDGPAADDPTAEAARRGHRWRTPLAAWLAGLASFAGIWGFLSEPAETPGLAEELIRRTPEAHGQDVVTVTITDFRGLDTLAEITVLLIAVAGVATLVRKGKLW
ncbi:NADH dehydrogenase (Quinone), Na(+)/H(+) antiporter subunit A [Modestobacter italicus]|uniref:NADH dehydrogenase (Quinone), Na(+)/H(+) antiporter subunit A n=1 Tax=Modestobacter italicus (strain DSM 44449 / CECT 9708 / BC 501) TaxID=2732864 RepID=I4EYG4_MODI5|nr:hydrogen gas-evolving membrane-bound hydrogenase subunit E [Modestobacter marinus]CCH88427.1 NADH dehydrogenase (Quinone), Na(+)/H(+) antiporter subunit A [Modestobacter marinus]